MATTPCGCGALITRELQGRSLLPNLLEACTNWYSFTLVEFPEGVMITRAANLISVAFFLSLDNFRTSVILGPLRLRWTRVLLVAAVFGFWDTAAPLLGLLVGGLLAERIGVIATYIGPATLGVFGLFLLLQAYQHWNNEPDEMEDYWTMFGLPLPLSVDNFVGGTSLGLLWFSPWISALTLGLMTFLMSIVGLVLGRLVARIVRLNFRYELLTGCGLLIDAIVLAVLASQGVDI